MVMDKLPHDMYRYLLSNKFDVFGLLDIGAAVHIDDYILRKN